MFFHSFLCHEQPPTSFPCMDQLCLLSSYHISLKKFDLLNFNLSAKCQLQKEWLSMLSLSCKLHQGSYKPIWCAIGKAFSVFNTKTILVVEYQEHKTPSLIQNMFFLLQLMHLLYRVACGINLKRQWMKTKNHDFFPFHVKFNIKNVWIWWGWDWRWIKWSTCQLSKKSLFKLKKMAAPLLATDGMPMMGMSL